MMKPKARQRLARDVRAIKESFLLSKMLHLQAKQLWGDRAELGGQVRLY